MAGVVAWVAETAAEASVAGSVAEMVWRMAAGRGLTRAVGRRQAATGWELRAAYAAQSAARGTAGRVPVAVEGAGASGCVTSASTVPRN